MSAPPLVSFTVMTPRIQENNDLHLLVYNKYHSGCRWTATWREAAGWGPEGPGRGASIPVELRCTTLLAHKCTHQLEVPQSLYLWDSHRRSSGPWQAWSTMNQLSTPSVLSGWWDAEPESSKTFIMVWSLATSPHTGGHPESPHQIRKILWWLRNLSQEPEAENRYIYIYYYVTLLKDQCCWLIWTQRIQRMQST